jgi:SAM-dependent methyltransferase
MCVLDVGSGLCGPARTLASAFGCTVEVLDITEEFCRASEMLTVRTGLSNLLSFRHGSALKMSYPDTGFDVAWTQHSSMNITDQERLYAEIQRVLHPSGGLALHEILARPVSPIHLPVLWAQDPGLSHLRPPEKVPPSQRHRFRRASVDRRDNTRRAMAPGAVRNDAPRTTTAQSPPHVRRRLRHDVTQPGAQPELAPDLHSPRGLRATPA